MPKPSLWLALSEIWMHPWYNEKIATSEEVIQEMTWRQKLSQDTSTVESSATPDSQAATEILTELSNWSEEDVKEGEGKGWKIKLIDQKQILHTSFFSTSAIDSLFNTLVVFSKWVTSDIKVSKN